MPAETADAVDTAPTPRWRMTVEPGGWACDAAPTQTLLAAALAAGIPLRSACRNGTYRACLSALQSGDVAYVIDWPGLSADERREGGVLPCVAQPRSDVVLRMGDRAWG